jgi:hypothetical protein
MAVLAPRLAGLDQNNNGTVANFGSVCWQSNQIKAE